MRKPSRYNKLATLENRIAFVKNAIVGANRMQLESSDWNNGFLRGLSFACSVMEGSPDKQRLEGGFLGKPIDVRYNPRDHDFPQ